MLGSILISLICLSVLILVHELGHFLVAKKFGVWVEEFGFGLPPKVFKKKIKDTIYSLNLLPFGGFVRLHGEMAQDKITLSSKAFLNKSKLKRTAIILAGVVMNFLLGVLIFAISYSFTGIPRNTKNVKIVDIAPGSPAQVSGLLVGDIVRKVNTKDIYSVEDFVSVLEENKGKKVSLYFDRELGGEKENKTISVSPRIDPPEGEGALGVTITTSETYFPPIYLRPFYGIYYGTKEALFWGKTVVVGFYDMIINLFKGITPKDVAGPVGIFAITSQAAKIGILSLMNFVGILSINFAILNVLPFPALDGGRLLFIFLEIFVGKKPFKKVENIIHTIGLAILILLLLAVTVKDIQRLIVSGGLSGFIDSMLK